MTRSTTTTGTTATATVDPGRALELLRIYLADDFIASRPELAAAVQLAIRRLVMPPGDAALAVMLRSSSIVPPGSPSVLYGSAQQHMKVAYLAARACYEDGTSEPCRWPIERAFGGGLMWSETLLYDGGDFPALMLGQQVSVEVRNPGPRPARYEGELVGVVPTGCFKTPPTCGYLINDQAAAEIREKLAALVGRVAQLEVAGLKRQP
jgi:hypothetical protein